jgi:sirohydrochlorin ferrochelatase
LPAPFGKRDRVCPTQFFVDPESVHEVYVVPNFISKGYFTQTVIPRELELNNRITKGPNGQIWKYCEPLGKYANVRRKETVSSKEFSLS